MFYYIYKITNIINGKIYVGVHKTKDLEDGYMGSGKVLNRAIKKYGLENFKKEIINHFDNSEDMFNAESQLVNEEFVSRDDTYNLKVGGFGGFDYINENYSDEKRTEVGKIGRIAANKVGAHIKGSTSHSLKMENSSYKSEFSKKVKEGLKRSGYEEGVFKGKTHSEETKRKIGKSNSVNQMGESNSNYGKVWVYNLTEKRSTCIKKAELSRYEKLGWIKGRKIKF